MAETKVYVNKTLLKTKYRKIYFVCRQKQHYQKHGIGIWWKSNTGGGCEVKPNKVLKSSMVGIALFNIKIWFGFVWIGKQRKK